MLAVFFTRVVVSFKVCEICYPFCHLEERDSVLVFQWPKTDRRYDGVIDIHTSRLRERPFKVLFLIQSNGNIAVLWSNTLALSI